MVASKSQATPRTVGRNAVADRALEILLCFTDDTPTRTADQLGEANGMSRSTTYRYLNSLRSTGFLVEEPGRGYRLGPKIIEMARIARRFNSILDIARPYLSQIASETGEVVQLLERVGSHVIMLDNIESRHRIGLTYTRGQLLPSPAGASAKVLIAYAPTVEREAILASVSLERYTDRSITDRTELERHLALVRQQGYAINDGELDEGIRAVAAPIQGRDAVRYAVSLVGPWFRLTDEKMPDLIEAVTRCAAEISARLREYEI